MAPLSSPAQAARLALLLVALVAATSEGEKDTCLLQIGSSVHEREGGAADCGDGAAQAILPGQPSRSQLTLLQVAARTGEVSQYLTSHQEEDSSPSPDPEHHAAITPERRMDIASLLSHGAAGSNKAAAAASAAGAGSEEALMRMRQDAQASDVQHQPHDDAARAPEAAAPAKPDVKELQGAKIAPFGKEDTARELQHHAARTQDTLVDAIENAEVAEIKRSIFRSLTRLRAAEIKEFDTIARLETQAIDEYNDNHHYRTENPLDYIHTAEVPVKEDKYTSFHD